MRPRNEGDEPAGPFADPVCVSPLFEEAMANSFASKGTGSRAMHGAGETSVLAARADCKKVGETGQGEVPYHVSVTAAVCPGCSVSGSANLTTTRRPCCAFSAATALPP